MLVVLEELVDQPLHPFTALPVSSGADGFIGKATWNKAS